MKDYTGVIVVKLFFEYVLTKLSSLKILMSDRFTHFLNESGGTGG